MVAAETAVLQVSYNNAGKPGEGKKKKRKGKKIKEREEKSN